MSCLSGVCPVQTDSVDKQSRFRRPACELLSCGQPQAPAPVRGCLNHKPYRALTTGRPNQLVLENLGLGGSNSLQEPVQKRTYTRTADKVVQREPSGRVRKKPVRLIDETAPALFHQDLRPSPLVFDVPSSCMGNTLCFCGKREDGDTGRYVPCGLSSAFAQFTAARAGEEGRWLTPRWLSTPSRR